MPNTEENTTSCARYRGQYFLADVLGAEDGLYFKSRTIWTLKTQNYIFICSFYLQQLPLVGSVRFLKLLAGSFSGGKFAANPPHPPPSSLPPPPPPYAPIQRIPLFGRWALGPEIAVKGNFSRDWVRLDYTVCFMITAKDEWRDVC